VLLILVGALGATMLVLQAGDRIEVIKVTKDIEAGESVSDDNVTSVMVAEDSGVDYVPWAQRKALKALKARTTIYAGTVVVGQMFAEEAKLPAGKAAVGLALKEGQYPSDLKSGDTVAVYNVDAAGGSSNSDSSDSSSSSTSASGGGLIAANAKVSSVADESDATISTGNLSVTLLVDQADAAAVTKAASAGAVSVVHVSGSGN
jgi:hypothetical protein